MKPRSVTVRAHGHPVLRGTHAKTLEMTAETEVSARATCVLGVSAQIPSDLAVLRGDVRLTLTVDGRSVTGAATVNPDHNITDRLVIRRSDSADADTFAIRSSLTAADLPADFSAALRSADAVVTLTVAEIKPPQPLVVIRSASAPPSGRFRALCDDADDVVLSRPPTTWPGRVLTAALCAAHAWNDPAARSWLALASSNRTRFAVGGPSEEQAEQPLAALLAAGLTATPVLWLGRLDRQAVRAATTRAAIAESTAPTVAVLARCDATAVLDGLAALEPTRQVAAPDDIVDVGVGLEWMPAAAAAERYRNDGSAAEIPLVVAPVGGAGSVNVVALLRALEHAGVPARTVAEALAPLGWDRRALYKLHSRTTEKT